MGEKGAWKRERSEASALGNSYGGEYWRNVLKRGCWVNLDLDVDESWGILLFMAKLALF